MESPPSSPAPKRARLLPPANDGATRRPVPLLVAAVYDAADFSRVDVRLVDVSSGSVAARLDGLRGGAHLGSAGGLVCLVGAAAVRVLDPATGAATDIIAAPGDTTTAVAHGHGQRAAPPSHVFGQVPATGEYKLLRIHAAAAAAHGQSQTCEILTLSGGGGEQPPSWRPAPSPPAPVAAASYRNKAVARGVAHFLVLPSPPPPFHHGAAECDAVASFDLAAEAWRPSLLRGPLSTSGGGRRVCRGHLSLAELNGGLAMAHHDYPGGCIDVWMLADTEKGEWVRTHSLRLAAVLRGWGGQMVAAGDRESLAQLLAVLDDGRIALWVEGKGLVRVFDPRTGAYTEVADLGRYSNVVGLCTAAIG